jgi:hypothetical protein
VTPPGASYTSDGRPPAQALPVMRKPLPSHAVLKVTRASGNRIRVSVARSTLGRLTARHVLKILGRKVLRKTVKGDTAIRYFFKLRAGDWKAFRRKGASLTTTVLFDDYGVPRSISLKRKVR